MKNIWFIACILAAISNYGWACGDGAPGEMHERISPFQRMKRIFMNAKGWNEEDWIITLSTIQKGIIQPIYDSLKSGEIPREADKIEPKIRELTLYIKDIPHCPENIMVDFLTKGSVGFTIYYLDDFYQFLKDPRDVGEESDGGIEAWKTSIDRRLETNEVNLKTWETFMERIMKEEPLRREEEGHTGNRDSLRIIGDFFTRLRGSLGI